VGYTGRCNCGAVTATVGAEPVAVRRCWCRQCQKAAAGSATTNAMFATDAIAFEGELSGWSYVAASGNTLTQSFCGQCGTPIMGQSSARPQFRTLRLGFLDEPHGLRPQVAIWLDEKPEWAVEDGTLDCFAAQPPAPPKV
jgi:hypothetical protein